VVPTLQEKFYSTYGLKWSRYFDPLSLLSRGKKDNDFTNLLILELVLNLSDFIESLFNDITRPAICIIAMINFIKVENLCVPVHQPQKKLMLKRGLCLAGAA